VAIYSRITGTGSYLPKRRLSNQEMVNRLAQDGIETSHEWIVERTGIEARYFAADEEKTSDLAYFAATKAIEAAQIRAEQIDLIIVATTTPDMVFPSTAALLQHKLGISGCPAFDIQAVCSGFVYALSVADAMVRSGSYRCALVVGAEIFSRILDFQDRTTCVLFGDGAGAVIVQASESPGILASDLHADGQYAAILNVPGQIQGNAITGKALLTMDGQAVFKLAVGVLEQAAHAVLEKAGKVATDVNWLIPHQANIRIMHGTARKLKIPLDKMIVTVQEHGNTSAASIPLALDVGVRSGKIQKEDLLMLEGVGGGFTWGALLLVF
jgi:3-oxoacyl-[acyl-carrier-protein] synthase-3